MSETVFNLYEAKTSLSKLVDRAAAGEEIIIAKSGKPMARLVPFHGPRARRESGIWKGQIRVAADFDEPLPAELQTAFEKSNDED